MSALGLPHVPPVRQIGFPLAPQERYFMWKLRVNEILLLFA